jgi:hypothetical protein
MTHVRIPTRATGHRINDRPSTQISTLCGATVTDRDLSIRDAIKDINSAQGFLTCPKCRRLVVRQ